MSIQPLQCPCNPLAIAIVIVVQSLAPISASAQSEHTGPRITGVWGARSPGSAVTVVGAGFGEAAPQVESSLGPQGWIETAPQDSPIGSIEGAPRWNTFATRTAPFVRQGPAHSGTRLIDASVDRGADGDWQKVLRYSHPERSDSIYATWWVWFEPIKYPEGTQWKMWRVSDDAGANTVKNNCASPYQNSYWDPHRGPTEYVTLFLCQDGCEWPAARRCTAEVQPDPWYAPRDGDPFQYRHHDRGGAENFAVNLPEPGVWCRMEFFLQASDADIPNGRYWLAINKPGETRRLIDNWVDGLLTHTSDCCSDPGEGWQHFVLQGYWDDNGGAFDDEEATILYDDIYLQFGSEARVELGNAPTLGGCTQLEVQELVEWSDAEIQIRLNHGGLDPAEPSWLFVISDAGEVSVGMPVRLEADPRR